MRIVLVVGRICLLDCNLFEPVDVDLGAHGRFDDRSVDDKPLPAPIAHPIAYGAAASASVAALGAIAWRLLRR